MALDVTQFYSAASIAGLLSAATWAGGSVDVLFQNDAPDMLGMESAGPRCRVPAVSVPGVGQNSTFTIATIPYVVAYIHPDTPNLGETTLVFRKTS